MILAEKWGTTPKLVVNPNLIIVKYPDLRGSTDVGGNIDKNITMNIEKILNGKKYRDLFDNLSDEFGKSPIDSKLNVLASLNYWNLLDQVIKEYQQKYKQKKDKYILDQLKPTLQFLIQLAI